MIGLDTHCQQLLLVLLQEKNPLPASKLARKLRITPRMARYRLNRVELWLHLKGLVLIKRPGVGFFIDARPEIKQALLYQLEKIEADSLVLPPHKRKYLMIITILFSSQPVVVKQFQSILNISRTTVLKDFDEIDIWLERYGLVLQRRQNFGCQIIGKENDTREAIIDCFIEGVGEENLLSYMGDKYAYHQPINIDKIRIDRPYLDFLQKINIDYFARLILKEEAGILSLSDRAFIWLVMCLATLIYRLSNGYLIDDLPTDASSERVEDIYQLIKKITTKTNRQFGIKLPEKEIAYLANQMQKAAIRKSMTSMLWENNNDSEPLERIKAEYRADVLSLAEEIVTYASVYLHPALKVDNELLRNLAAHLTHLPQTIGSRTKIRNPLLGDIKREYAHIYTIAQNCVDITSQRFGFPISDDEIGYLTMYLAAAMERLCISERKKKVLIICNAGRATAMLLVSRIRVEFPGIDIVGVMSYLEWKNRIDLVEYDLIVSTIPIQAQDIPVVLASPLLAVQDVANIRIILEKTQRTAKTLEKLDSHEQTCLSTIIKPDMIKLNAAAQNWQEVVEISGEQLLKHRMIEPRYIQAMKDTIVKFGPYMVIWQGTVLLHARPEDGVKQLCMSLTTFRTPISFGHVHNDPVDMAFVLGAIDHCSHMPALYELSDLMRNQEAVTHLRNATNPHRVIKILSDHCMKEYH